MMLIEFKRKMGYRIGAKLLRATAHFLIYMIFLLYSNLKKMIKTIATNSKMIRTVHF